jgi:hypothetical protein
MPPEESSKHLGSHQSRNSEKQTFKGINYLFAIAIDDYQYCPRLYNCVRDAKELIETLTAHYPFKKEHVITLYNEKATEGNIFRTFRQLAEQITPEDNLVIFFSGHGEYDKVFDEGYWIPVNSQLGAFEDYLANSKLKTILNAINTKHTFLIADSCFSGSLFTRFKGTGLADRLENDPSRWGLTAGRNEIVSDGKEGANSPFADSLLYQLKNNKKSLGVAELCQRVIEGVVATADQTPRGEPLKVKGHRGGQFFFHPMGILAEEPKETAKRGNVLYQVPPVMEVEKETRCTVRIAFDEVQLLKDLEVTDDTTIKSIKVSNVMTVELVDPLGNEHFQIRSISSAEQFIDKEDFTQWIFYVKPLKKGKHPLMIKVSVIEMVYGKERTREIVLEETIEVVAQVPEQQETTFKSAGYSIALTEEAELSPPPAPPQPAPAVVIDSIPSVIEQPVPGTKTKAKRPYMKIIGGIAASLLLVTVIRVAFFPDGGGSPKPVNPSDNGVKIPKSEYNWKDLVLTIDTRGKYGYKDREGFTRIPAKYDNAAPEFSEGFAWVMSNKKVGYIDQSGKLVIPMVFDGGSNFRSGKAKVQYGDKSLLIDTEGNALINNRKVDLRKYIQTLDRISEETEGSTTQPILRQLVFKTGSNGKYGVQDRRTGEWIVQPKYRYYRPYKSGVAFVQNDRFLWALIDANGKEITPHAINMIHQDFQNGIAVITIDGKSLKMDTKGNIFMGNQKIPIKNYLERR